MKRDVSERAFSVVYGGKFETLDLICDNPDQRDKWIEALRYLIESSGGDDLQTFLKQMWSRVDKNGDGKLDMNEILSLLHSLNVKYNKKQIKRDFELVNKF